METIRAAGCCSAPPKTWTTYSGMSDWRHLQGISNNVPVTLVNGSWKQVQPRPITNPPYKPFEEPGRSDEYYRRYLKLAQNVAHKYPNPGLPIERHGRAGASWRHIKEVQSHNNRVLYVDGIVRLYDQDYLSSFASRHMPPGFGKPQADSHTPKQIQRHQTDTDWALTPKARPINATTTFLPGNPIKYKGFYNYK